MTIGIFGGTFDPPHKGHELFIKTFTERYKPDRMFVVPTGIPPHKQCELTSAERRLEMAKIAFKGIAEVSGCEIRREGKSYTSDTLAYFAKRFPEAKLIFLIGSDMLFSFDSWHEPEKILRLCKIVASPRENGIVAEMKKKAEEIMKRLGGEIEIMELSPELISSTAIRDYGKDGVAPQVAEYIAKHGLYEESDEIKRLKSIMSKRLSPKRYCHSVGVMNTAAELGKKYGGDIERLKIAGLVHDCTKELTVAGHYELIAKYNVVIPPDEQGVEKLLHARTGAVFAKYELGINDEEIISAIACHTAGKANMTRFEQILYLADYIDPTRDYKDVRKLRKLAFTDFDEALIFATSYSICDLVERGKSLAIGTVDTYNDVIKRRNMKEKK